MTIRYSLCALLLLASCVSNVPKENFYTLSSEATSPQIATGEALPTTELTALPNASISVGPVSISEIADRPQLVVRTSPNRVDILEQQRWAQPLKNEIARVVAENLGQLLGTAKVSAYPNQASQADYRVTINIQKFESIAATSASIAASWTIRHSDGSSTSGNSQISEAVPAATPGTGRYDAIVMAHSRALVRLSREIAAAISTSK